MQRARTHMRIQNKSVGTGFVKCEGVEMVSCVFALKKSIRKWPLTGYERMSFKTAPQESMYVLFSIVFQEHKTAPQSGGAKEHSMKQDE